MSFLLIAFEPWGCDNFAALRASLKTAAGLAGGFSGRVQQIVAELDMPQISSDNHRLGHRGRVEEPVGSGVPTDLAGWTAWRPNSVRGFKCRTPLWRMPSAVGRSDRNAQPRIRFGRVAGTATPVAAIGHLASPRVARLQ